MKVAGYEVRVRLAGGSAIVEQMPPHSSPEANPASPEPEQEKVIVV